MSSIELNLVGAGVCGRTGSSWQADRRVPNRTRYAVDRGARCTEKSATHRPLDTVVVGGIANRTPVDRSRQSHWDLVDLVCLDVMDRKRKANGDDEVKVKEEEEEAMPKLEPMVRSSSTGSATASTSSASQRRSRPKHSHPPAPQLAIAPAAAAAAAPSSSSIAARPAPSMMRAPPPRRPLYGPSAGPNLLLNLQSRSMNLLAPGRLRDRIVAARVGSLQLAQNKEIKSAHTLNINDLDVDKTEAR
jgi:hypothetical protein